MTLQELIEALEKASGPSFQMDGMIWCAANDLEFVMWDGAGCVYRDPTSPKWDAGIKHAPASMVRPYTASVDAAMALCDRVLPGWCFSVQSLPRWAREGLQGPLHAAYSVPDDINSVVMNAALESGEAISVHKSPALAICLATLRAKLSQEKNNAAE